MTLRERVAAGDRAALGEAFELFHALAIGALRKQRVPSGAEDDIAQDAFLRLPECARHCHPATTIEGCVVTAVHQARRNYRTNRATANALGQGYNGRPARVVDISPRAALALPDPGDDPEVELQARERAHHLAELLERLPARSRELLLAREIEDLTTPEIAARFAMCPSSVSTMIWIARGRLVELARKSPIAEVFEAMPLGRGAYRAA